MRDFVDLHTHSTASDGALRPDELVELADKKRLAAIALTDHDTTEGLPAAIIAARKYPELHFIPGVEISAQFPGGALHILGLGIQEDSAGLQEILRRLREAREQRNPKIIAKLQQLGLDIDISDVRAAARDIRAGEERQIIGRLHIAEALRRKHLVSSNTEAFAKYIGARGAAYVDKERLSPSSAIAAIREARGVPVLAHPAQLNCGNRAQLERIVRELISLGLEGLEVYHTDHTPQQTRGYLDLCRRYELLPTGGSDFHGLTKPEGALGRPRVPISIIADAPFAKGLLPNT